MANHAGSEGKVKVGANTVAEVRDWSIEESAEVLDDTTMGDTWITNKSSLKSWTASVNCFWDETDTNGQQAMTIGAEVTLNLYPEGDTTGDIYYTGSAIITSLSRTGSYNGMVESSFSATGNGALTQSTA